MPFRPLSTRQNLPYVVSLEQHNANLRVPGAFNGSSPPPTGELCYRPPPWGYFSSVVRVPAYYDAPLVPTDSLVSEKTTSKQIAAFSSPLPTPQLSPPKWSASQSYSSAVRCSIHLVSKLADHSRNPWVAHFFSAVFFFTGYSKGAATLLSKALKKYCWAIGSYP